MKKINPTFDEDLNNFQNRLINPVLVAAMFLGLVALGSSLLRYLQFGWLNVFYIHIGTYLVLVVTTLFRKKLDVKFKVIILISMMFMVGSAGIIARGVMSSGAFWFLGGGIMAIYILGDKTSLLYILSGIFVMILAAYFTIKGQIQYNFNLEAYVKSSNTWSVEILTAALVSILVFISVKMINSFFYNSLIESKQTENNIRLIIDSVAEGIIVFDEQFRILEANKSFSKLVNAPLNKIIGSNAGNFIDNEHKALYKFNIDDLPAELHINKHNGENSELSINVSNTPIIFKGEKAILSVLINVTEQKQQERKRLELIMETEETERGKFAKELHDGVGPILSTSKMYLDILKSNKLDNEGEFVLGKIQEAIDDALQSLKEISNNISPHVLKNFGLVSAIKNFTEKHQKSFNVIFHFESDLTDRFDENIEVSLYRITIELINNTLKYAQANNIYIKLNLCDDHIVFYFEHDGLGFNYNKVKEQKKGMGLFNIEHRVGALNGKLRIETSPEKNFKVTISFKVTNLNS